MYQITLQAIPRQKLSVTLDSIQYELTFVAVRNCMYVTVGMDGETVLSGSRCVCGYPIIPYKSIEGEGGNFVFYTGGDDLPWWENFGVDHFLYYLTNDEVSEIRA